MTSKTKITLLVAAAIVFLLAFGWWLMSARFHTKVDKEMLKYFGGKCVVTVYQGGVAVEKHEVDGYVLYETGEDSDNSRHDGVVTFKAKDGETVRVGGWGGVVTARCK